MIKNHLRFSNFTGLTFPTELTSEGHKKGKLCLRCGKYVGGLICDECKDLKKCKLCGIICRTENYRVYRYHSIKGQKGISKEVFEIVVPFCKVLIDDFCESCKDWENKIKHICSICENPFDNTFKNYKQNSNRCSGCVSKLSIWGTNFDKMFDFKGNPRLEKLSTPELGEELSDAIIEEEINKLNV